MKHLVKWPTYAGLRVECDAKQGVDEKGDERQL